MLSSLFFFNDTATTEIYTLSLHDALPIYGVELLGQQVGEARSSRTGLARNGDKGMGWLAGKRSPRIRFGRDRKSTRLNSSHQIISYAVFCLKKKKHSHPGDQRVRHGMHTF